MSKKKKSSRKVHRESTYKKTGAIKVIRQPDRRAKVAKGKPQSVRKVDTAKAGIRSAGNSSDTGRKRTGRSSKSMIMCPLFVWIALSMAIVYVWGLLAYAVDDYEEPMSLTMPAFAHVAPEKVSEITSKLRKKPDKLAIEKELAQALEVMEETEIPVEEVQIEEPEVDYSYVYNGEPEEEEDGYINNEIVNADGSISIVEGNVTEFEPWNDNKPRTIYCDNPGLKPLTTEYDFLPVDNSYYDSAIFIGDSRIAGLYAYSGYTGATFMYKTGLNIWNVMNEELEMGEGLQYRVEDVLSVRQYRNVYLMLGINELAVGTSQKFGEQYASVIGQIRRMQPAARIIIMSIMNVTSDYSRNPDVFNNDNINSRNYAISKLANGRSIFYLDVNPAVCDETGGLRHEITFDGVHLTAQYYYLLTDFLNEHGY